VEIDNGPPKDFVSSLRINTVMKEDDVKFLDFIPLDNPVLQRDYPFVCPVCFRYFNQIMVSDCCREYTCHKCAADWIEEEINKYPKFKILCPFRCLQFVEGEPYTLRDVDPSLEVKLYTDSQVDRAELLKAGAPSELPVSEVTGNKEINDPVVRHSRGLFPKDNYEQ